MKDENVSDILTIGLNKVYVEIGGKLKKTDVRFSSREELNKVIHSITAPLGKKVDESMPLLDGRLPDGSRINVVVEPLAIDGPMISIRKFMKKMLTPEEMINIGSISAGMLDFIKLCVRGRKNIIISGGTGSGKTTLLNLCSSFIPGDERIVTIEDAAELRIEQANVGRLESRPPDVDGKGEISIRRLVINSLRMRPDRIIVGECRGGEALDMIQAMNTGHDGSLTTIHANSPRDMLKRLEVLIMMSGLDIPSRAIREQVASAVDIVIQSSRLQDGSRKIIEISEITGMEGNVLLMAPIFKFIQSGVNSEGKVQGKFCATGAIPVFLNALKMQGFKVDMSMFAK
ncbi:CpaF family protein [bacterium]|nr:CpaF family protein [bacterium]MBU4134279.1 CpaF family protein [bacterium]